MKIQETASLFWNTNLIFYTETMLLMLFRRPNLCWKTLEERTIRSRDNAFHCQCSLARLYKSFHETFRVRRLLNHREHLDFYMFRPGGWDAKRYF